MTAILVVLIILCVIGGAALYWGIAKGQGKKLGKIFGLSATGLFLILFISGCFVQVPAGYRGVLLRFGATTGRTLDQGLGSKLPVIDSVFKMSVQTQKYEVDAAAVSKTLQDVKTKVAINYRLEPTAVADIYRTLGVDYIERIAAPAIQETVKAITAKYSAEDLILQREVVKNDIANDFKQRMAARGIIVEVVNITNFEFSPEFTQSIEAKMVAAQNVLQAQNKLLQVQVEAQQAEAAAKGRAAAVIAEAEGQAKAIFIVTEAQVQANEKIAQSLTKDVLQYIFIDRLGKDIRVVVIPSGQQFVLGDLTR